MKTVIRIVVVAFVIGAGIGIYFAAHKAGEREGFEAGRFAEHAYADDKGLADSCYEWATVYDKKKPGNTDHVEKYCDSMMKTARSWVGNKPMQGMAGIY